MAEKNIINRPDITFYLYRKKDNKLHLKDTKIYSPYNVKTRGFETDKFDFFDPKYVKFEKGVYKLSLAEIGSEDLYDQTKEFLSFYNYTGGTLTKGVDYDQSKVRNGKRFSCGKSPCYVATEEIKTKEDKVKIVTKEVQVQTMPRSFAEGLSHIQLSELCNLWNIEIPGDIEESGVVDEIKNKYLELLKERLVD